MFTFAPLVLFFGALLWSASPVQSSNLFTLQNASCSTGIWVSGEYEIPAISECNPDGCYIADIYHYGNSTECSTPANYCLEKGNLTINGGDPSCVTCHVVMTTSCDNISVEVSPQVSLKFKGLSFGASFSLRVNFDIDVQLDGNLVLPCSCHLCPNSIDFTIPIPVHYDLINIAKLAAMLGIPGGTLYEIIHTLHDLFIVYEEVTEITECVEGIFETATQECHLIDIPAFTSCAEIIGNLFSNLISKRSLTRQSSENSTLLLTDPASYSGPLTLYTNLEVTDLLEGLIAFQLPSFQYSIVPNTGNYSEAFQNGSYHLNYTSMEIYEGYALVISDSLMDKFLSNSTLNGANRTQVTFQQYFEYSKYIFDSPGFNENSAGSTRPDVILWITLVVILLLHV